MNPEPPVEQAPEKSPERGDTPNQFMHAGSVEDGLIVMQVHTICPACADQQRGTFSIWKSLRDWFLLEKKQKCKRKKPKCKFKFNTLLKTDLKADDGEPIFKLSLKKARHVQTKIKELEADGYFDHPVHLTVEPDVEEKPEDMANIIDLDDERYLEVVDDSESVARAAAVRRRISGSEPPGKPEDT